jgi:predicted cupin superfamily sugar epimerase
VHVTVDSTQTSRADELIALLDLRPHPEGGFYRVDPGFDFADFRLLADDRALADVVRRAWPTVASLV